MIGDGLRRTLAGALGGLGGGAAADRARLLVGFPGPAALADGAGAVLAATDKAVLLAPDGRRLAPAVADLVARALAGRTVAVDLASLPGERGSPASVELVAVPLAAGEALVIGRNVTLDTNLRNALIDSRQRYRDLIEASGDFAWEVDAAGRFVFVSPAGTLGYAPEDLIGRRPEDFALDRLTFSDRPFASEMRIENHEIWLRAADGQPACLVVYSLPVRAPDGRRIGARGTWHDVTAERNRDTALARAYHREELLNHIVAKVRDEVDPADMLAAAATATARTLGAAGCRILRCTEVGGTEVAAEWGQPAPAEIGAFAAALGADEGARVGALGGLAVLAHATRYRQAVNGAICLWRGAGAPAWDDGDRLLIADVANQLGIANEQISNHERIVRLSRTDGLTGLLNRRAFFEEELPRRLQRLARDGKGGALIYVDLDNFKRVNDVHGHQRGDEALLALRALLAERSRPGDLIARLGGDEFALWMDGVDAAIVRGRAEALLAAAAGLRRFSGDEAHPLGLSIGAAVFDPGAGEPLEELVARADAAMYAVKRRGKGGFEVDAPAAAGREA
jgi:diguanylate cyclase (GGDEF)-like protein/PAS domain S-box-containing protein